MSLLFRSDYCMKIEGKNNDVLKLKQDTQSKILKIKDELKKELRAAAPKSKPDKPSRTERHGERAFKGSLSEGKSGRSRRTVPTPPPPLAAWDSSDQDKPPALEAMSANETKVSPLFSRTRTYTRTPSTSQGREKATGNDNAGQKVLGRRTTSSAMNDLEECRDITKEKLMIKAQKSRKRFLA